MYFVILYPTSLFLKHIAGSKMCLVGYPNLVIASDPAHDRAPACGLAPLGVVPAIIT